MAVIFRGAVTPESTWKCGVFNYQWELKLDQARSYDGWLVMENFVGTEIDNCPCGPHAWPNPAKPAFYEAWFVKAGNKSPTKKWMQEHGHGGDENHHDWTRLLDEKHNVGGVRLVRGNLRFFRERITGDLDHNPDWNPANVPDAGGLPATRNQPTWWDTDWVQDEGEATRMAGAEWDCCDKPGTNSPFHDP
jgi:hypothetical protein